MAKRARGKSETMAARLVWLVANGMVRPDRVLGLTFTREGGSPSSPTGCAPAWTACGERAWTAWPRTGTAPHVAIR